MVKKKSRLKCRCKTVIITISDEYMKILNQLSKEWFLAESEHNISKSASDALWNLGSKWFPLLYDAKRRQNIRKNVPQFVHIRRRINEKNSPPITLKIAYEEKETGQVITINSKTTPTLQYPRSTHTKLHEIAFVEVNFFSKNNAQSWPIINAKTIFCTTAT